MTAISNVRGGQQTSVLAVRLARIREAAIVVLLVIIIAVVTAIETRFISKLNIRSILLWVPLLTVVAMGQMMVIIIRGIDVSVGSTLGFAGIVVGMIFRDHPGFNMYLGTLLVILIGAVLGAINGRLIAWVKIPPVISTLALV